MCPVRQCEQTVYASLSQNQLITTIDSALHSELCRFNDRPMWLINSSIDCYILNWKQWLFSEIQSPMLWHFDIRIWCKLQNELRTFIVLVKMYLEKELMLGVEDFLVIPINFYSNPKVSKRKASSRFGKTDDFDHLLVEMPLKRFLQSRSV